MIKVSSHDPGDLQKAKILLQSGAKFMPSEKSEITIEDLLSECSNDGIKKEIENIPAVKKILEKTTEKD